MAEQLIGAEKLIGTALSTKELTFQPGYGVAQFEVSVVNYSDRFASFQLDIIAAGGDPSSKRTWYSLSPEISTKKPPGDTTTFVVEIHKTPIIGFVGLVNLTIQIFSLELGVEERHILRLRVEKGVGELVITAQLPNSNLQGYPNTDLDIPLRLYNPSSKDLPATIALKSATPWLSLPPASFNLPANQWLDYRLTCALPDIDRAIAGVSYAAQIEIAHPEGPPAQLDAFIQIFPQGQILLEVPNLSQTIPQKRPWIPFLSGGMGTWYRPTLIYPLLLENQSNQEYQATIDLPLKEKEKSPLTLELIPPNHTLSPTATETFDLKVDTPRPWIGWTIERSIPISVRLTRSEFPTNQLRDELDVRQPLLQEQPFSQPSLINGQQTLILKLFPIIPRWLQGLFVLLLLWLVWWLLHGQYYYIKHQAAVTAVQFNGLADRILSSSVDERIQSWIVEKKRLEFVGTPAETDKAIRTVKYRPVDNNEMAIGLENGEIQLWHLLSTDSTPLRAFAYQKDDRVMDLEFTADSRYLFSGHGSGLVAKWYVGRDFDSGDNPNEPELTQTFDFAIADIAFVGKERDILAISGRYNQLIFWDPQRNITGSLSISEGTATGQDNYITSLATVEQKPFMLAIADNQGRIGIWDVRSCLDSLSFSNSSDLLSCEQLDSWEDGHRTRAVRSLAFSADGLYLTSVGDDGRVILWPLRNTGERLTKYLQGQTIATHYQPLNAVDLAIIPSWKNNTDLLIQIVTGGDDGQVRLYQVNTIKN
ncbi:WD40 repeat domain-containing protein [Roseofilum casamattae]|uniref:WD40 repeat domain-containing protein n=1 Tax=Roseofilum casamattae BLCC-M143 TaxID=3022442 RepID=A0ABT7BZK0_9CYAN|nr:hypothetical protein [Roseofilum casamattae]MDJ1184222.1 hypothetical protein [Roseofilum casamattae BLCC-M143]